MRADKKFPRSKPLHGIFRAIPQRYDLINRIITWGFDERWRLKAARECLNSHPRKLLDLCCGTGDLAIKLANLADNSTEVVGIDYSLPMLESAVRKAGRLASGRRLSFVYGDVADLPFPDDSLDCIGISFAFRNLTYKNPLVKRYLAEVLRVLKSQGKFVIVESSQPKSKLIRRLFHLYLRQFVFRAGYWLSGNRGAYHYLAESASRFYTAGETKDLLINTGFREVSFRRLLFGVTALHVAIK